VRESKEGRRREGELTESDWPERLSTASACVLTLSIVARSSSSASSSWPPTRADSATVTVTMTVAEGSGTRGGGVVVEVARVAIEVSESTHGHIVICHKALQVEWRATQTILPRLLARYQLHLAH